VAGGRWVVLAGDGERLLVHDLGRLLSGADQPVAEFAGGWWQRHPTTWSVAPDLRTVVACREDEVVALDPSGAPRWRFAHPPRAGYPAEGGVQVSADGLCCWAVVPGDDWTEDDGDDDDEDDEAWDFETVDDEEDDDEDEDCETGDERWIVLRMADGALVGSAELDTVESEAVHHFAVPPGGQVAVSLAMGQEGEAQFLGRIGDDGGLDVRDLPGCDEILIAVHPRGESVISSDAPPRSLYVDRLPDGERLRWFHTDDTLASGEKDEDQELQWVLDDRALPGYLDDGRVLASCAHWDDGPRSLWLLDVPTGRLPAPSGRSSTLERPGLLHGPVGYGEHEPAGADMTLPLGDGTWLTADGPVLRRWTLD
jgi:hypothetical protein